MQELNKIPTSVKDGDESFISEGNKLNFRLLDFWSWSQSDLLNNTQRGVLAEFLVRKAVGITSTFRTDWDSFDLITKNGIRIEVKSSAYIQSWKQNSFSKITFDIAPKLAWDANTNEFSEESIRNSDYYVFCLLHHEDQASIDPMNLDQWTFYVLQTKVLNSEKGIQKSIGLQSLLKLNPAVCRFGEINSFIALE